MKNVAIIQARMGSTRFPGKVLENLYGKPVLEWVVNAAKKISLLDQIVVATSDLSQDYPIVEWCKKKGISFFQGDESDVLARFYNAAVQMQADIIMRLTADCPLLNSHIASQVLYSVISGHADYASNIQPPTWPDGLDCEAFTFSALKDAYSNAKRASDREHVTPYIRNNQYKYKGANIPAALPGLQDHRWTVDTKEDLDYVNSLLVKTEGDTCIYKLLKASENLKKPTLIRNEGFSKSLAEEEDVQRSFEVSQKMLARALKVIPVGSQTFSKSYLQYPQNTAPLFVTHGQGGKIWDVDGNEYVDLVSGLLPNVLGYNDVDVNFSIQSQLQKGISFSLATELEVKLAEKLVDIIPCAEMVRFGKNGTDATSAAVRLARAYTNREKIIVCGYHGWQDWYIGTTSRYKGIPTAVRESSISVAYNDLDRIEELLKTEEFAGIIIEPCNTTAPLAGYLQGIKDLCEKYGSVFIFDEIITGFRFSLGGAQQYFGVTPHLACFGKAMGNGMPISAVMGRKDIMTEMEEIFFSGTFGGETLSLAASLATIEKMKNQNVIDYLWQYGDDLASKVTEQIATYNLSEYIKLNGYAPWKILQFSDHDRAESAIIKTYFLQEMLKNGILVLGSHNICFAHNEQEKQKISEAYKYTLERLSIYLEEGCLKDKLESAVIQPLFKVR